MLPRAAARYGGKTFQWDEQDVTLVACILGEFYWKVDCNEQVWSTDFVRPPEILSREILHGGTDSGEVSWSHGVYVPGERIERAFGLAHSLPRPRRVSSNQPSTLPKLYACWLVMLGLALLLGIFFQSRARRAQVFSKQFDLPAVAAAARPQRHFATANGGGGEYSAASSGTAAGGDEGSIFFSDPIEIRGHENIEIQVAMANTNCWLGVDGDLVDESSGVVQEFTLPVEYYEGITDGEAWTEGSRAGYGLSLRCPPGSTCCESLLSRSRGRRRCILPSRFGKTCHGSNIC